MGLSNEERLTKFFWAAKSWRSRLVDLQEQIGRKEKESKAVVGDWIRRIDLLVGEVMLQTNRNSAYWLFGENDGSVAHLLAQDYDLRQYAEPDSYATMPETAYESISWWQDNVDHFFLVGRLQGHPFSSHEGINALARWWDAYAYISALIYPMWRYHDDLFPRKVQQQFKRLCGEMLNRRFEVCFPTCGTPDEEQYKLELFLLMKLRAFHLLLKTETKNWKGKRYLEKKYPGYELLERVGKMSALDLHNLFEKEQKRKWDWDRKYHRDEEAKKVKKESGILGPLVKKQEDECPTPEKTTTSTTKKSTSEKTSPTPAVTAPSGPKRKTTQETSPALPADRRTASRRKTAR